jgi:hypothetical protein
MQASVAPSGRPASPRRRQLLIALLGASLPGWAAIDPALGLTRWGSGEFRRFGVLVYEATLWAGDDPLRPPLALQLTYRRSIAGATIAQASVSEMRHLGGADGATLARWEALMGGLFPDVQAGDVIVGEYRDDGARFFHNSRWLGAVDDPAFARAFFAIWLDPRTRAPALRAALLTRGPGRA